MDHGSEEETESQGHTRWSMPRLPYLDHQIQIGAEGLLLDDASRIHSLQPPRVIESTAAAATTCLARFPSALTVTEQWALPAACSACRCPDFSGRHMRGRQVVA